ncbi:DUF6949 family protein [Hoeflea ulvae]|uniref:Sensor histidine kinase n=1 Tax=Hoeflea ulvae TaxID=2983764 RepID=A0ABT3YGT4_9HYPH|nr:hypothetical protein [Hoeflea ulvae]MCY0095110.1 hypothetical protein [Hoeflea ulvae]
MPDGANPLKAWPPDIRCEIGLELALAALIGPRLLIVNGFRSWRRGLVTMPLYTVLALVAGGWSMCSGVVVLQLAFASGYFLA